MANEKTKAGYLNCGIPYCRLGHGPRPLVVFQGLMFENKPPAGMMSSMYQFLADEYTIHVVLRKPGLPQGTRMKDMGDDYARMFQEEFGGAVDVIGVSTGGSIAQHFAADHPDLVRKLVIHSSAYTLSETAKALQMQVARLAQERKWIQANGLLLGSIFPQSGIKKALSRPVVWLAAFLMGTVGAPKDPSDLVVTVLAEDQHNFKERLGEITAPTLVIAGVEDPFYTETLFRETAAGIPYATLILYEGMGHPASGKQFQKDVLEFLLSQA
jgi:pimeloyl-ACP methyl ester carboxylesterase